MSSYSVTGTRDTEKERSCPVVHLAGQGWQVTSEYVGYGEADLSAVEPGLRPWGPGYLVVGKAS